MLKKLLLKEQLKNPAKPTGDSIADKITSLGKPKKKKVEAIYIPREKRRQIIDDLKFF